MLTSTNMSSLRPGDGLPPKYHSVLLGKRILRSVKTGNACHLGSGGLR
jgi:sialic acid synthase SpsE